MRKPIEPFDSFYKLLLAVGIGGFIALLFAHSHDIDMERKHEPLEIEHGKL